MKKLSLIIAAALITCGAAFAKPSLSQFSFILVLDLILQLTQQILIRKLKLVQQLS